MRSPLARRVTVRRALIAVAATALVVPVITGSAFAGPTAVHATSGGRATITGSSAPWLKSAHLAGAPSPSASVTFNLVLPLRNASVATLLANNVSNPKSPAYGHYLTAAQFNIEFGPTLNQIAAVKSFLSSSGLRVQSVAPGNRWVTASGTVKQIQKTFQTTLRTYTYKGHSLRANATPLSVPANIAGLVSGVVGITADGVLRQPDSGHSRPLPNSAASPHAASPHAASPHAAVPPTAACSTYWDQHEQVMPAAYGHTSFPTPGCGYSPSNLRTAYGVQSAVSSGNRGQGVTVAIVDAYGSPTILADANGNSTRNGEPTFTAGQYTETLQQPFTEQFNCGGAAGWNTEESLDVEAVHAMAPGANIHYVGASNCDSGLDDATNYVIQNHLADLVSNSYGYTGEDSLGSEVATEHSMFLQAAIEGIGFYYSTGDDADNKELVPLPKPSPTTPRRTRSSRRSAAPRSPSTPTAATSSRPHGEPSSIRSTTPRRRRNTC